MGFPGETVCGRGRNPARPQPGVARAPMRRRPDQVLWSTPAVLSVHSGLALPDMSTHSHQWPVPNHFLPTTYPCPQQEKNSNSRSVPFPEAWREVPVAPSALLPEGARGATPGRGCRVPLELLPEPPVSETPPPSSPLHPPQHLVLRWVCIPSRPSPSRAPPAC